MIQIPLPTFHALWTLYIYILLGSITKDCVYQQQSWLRAVITYTHTLCLRAKIRNYSTVSESFISFAFTFKQKKGLSSSQNPRKTHAKSSQNPRYFHATSTLISRSGSVSCVRFHACSTFSKKKSRSRKKNHAQEKKFTFM